MWRHRCFLTPEFPCVWRKSEREQGGDTRGVGVFLVRAAARSRGGYSCGLALFLSGGIRAEQTPVWPPSPCLFVWVNPLTRPQTRRPAVVCLCYTLP